MILLAISLVLLVLVILEVRGSFVFSGPHRAAYSQPYPGHALKLILAIAGTFVSFLAGLLLLGTGRKNR